MFRSIVVAIPISYITSELLARNVNVLSTVSTFGRKTYRFSMLGTYNQDGGWKAISRSIPRKLESTRNTQAVAFAEADPDPTEWDQCL